MSVGTFETHPAVPAVQSTPEPTAPAVLIDVTPISIDAFIRGKSLGAAFKHTHLLEHGGRVVRKTKSEWAQEFQQWLIKPRG